MSSNSHCPSCGSSISDLAQIPGCPRCAFRAALETALGPVDPPAPPPPARIGLSGVALQFHAFGEYELREELGRGAMGIVYRAWQPSLGREVALKVMLPGLFASAEALQRFRLEADTSAQLSHPHIVPTYEVGEEGGQVWFSMRLIEGSPLAERALSFDDEGIARLLIPIARAVHHAHQHGVLHRDLKPGNILVDRQGQPYLTDFGLAKLADRGSGLTRWGSAIGTPAYMSPEQAAGTFEGVTTASDIYGLGAVLYWLMCGVAPFEGSGVAETLRRVMDEEVRPPRERRPDRRPRSTRAADLEAVCLRCLRKDPARRYESAAALADDLERWQRGEPTLARSMTAGERLWRWGLRNRALAVSLVTSVVAVGMLGIGSIGFYRQREKDALALLRKEQQAERRATDALRKSYLAQAQAQVASGQPGQRLGALDAIAKATALSAGSSARILELRNAAIQALTLTDVRHRRTKQFQLSREFACFDRALERYAVRLPDGSIRLRHMQDDREWMRLPVGSSETDFWRPAEFSPDGRWLVLFSVRFQAWQVWDLNLVKLVLNLNGSAGVMTADGRFWGASDPNGGFALYDAAREFKKTVFLSPDRFSTFSLGWSGEIAALFEERTPGAVRLLDTGSGRVTGILSLPKEMNTCVWHPDGRHLALSCDEPVGSIQIWDTRAGAIVKTLSGHSSSVLSLAFHPHGTLLASSAWDNTTRLWSFPDGQELFHLNGQGLVAFAVDGSKLGVTHWDHDALSVFDLAVPGEELRRFKIEEDPAPGGEAIAFNSTGTILAHTAGGHLALRDAASLQRVATLTNGLFESVHADPTSAGFLVSRDRIATSLPLKPGERTAPFSPEPLVPMVAARGIGAFDLSADGLTWCAVAEGGVSLLDPRNNGSPIVFGQHEWARFLSVSPDGRWVATGAWNRKGVRVWNVREKRLERELLTDSMASVLFTQDGRWLITGSQQFDFWSVGSWKLSRQRLRPPLERFPPAMASTRDGRLIALSHTLRSVMLVDSATGVELATLALQNGWAIHGLSFDPKGTRLAVSGELTREFCVWNLGRIRERLLGLGLDWEDHPKVADVSEQPANRPAH